MLNGIRKLIFLKKAKGGGGLPAQYRETKGFEFSGGTYYQITGFKLRGSDTIRFSLSVEKSCNVFGCYTTTTAEDNFSLYASTSSNAKYLRYGSETYNSFFPSASLGNRFDVVISPTGTSGMPTDSVITPEDFTSPVDLCVGTTSPSGTSAKFNGKLYGKFIVDGRLKLVPCERISDGALGYYDMRSKAFFEPIGKAPVSLGYV